VAFPISSGDDYRTLILADGRGFLDCQVFEDQGLVVFDRLTWVG